MRILLLSPRQAWPLNSGAKLREYYLARALAKHADLTLLAFGEDSPEIRRELSFFQKVVFVPPPKRYTPSNLLRGFVGPTSLPVLNYTTPAMERALAEVIREPADVIQIEGTPMAGYVRQLGEPARRPLVVYDWHNIESELMERYAERAPSLARKLYAFRTAQLLRGSERTMLREGDAHFVCSSREKDQLQPQSRGPIQVIPNGVQTSAFAAAASGTARDRLIFVGTMDYHANILAAVTFANQVWPTLQAAQPQLRLTLVGANPTLEVRVLASRPGIEVTGTVPDLLPYYREAVASVVPLKTGGGTRLKVLEAMAAKVPVVSTGIGVEGIAVEPGRHFLQAETPKQWLEAIQTITSQPSVCSSLVSEGFRLVQQTYDWEVVGQGLWDFYSDLCTNRKPRN